MSAARPSTSPWPTLQSSGGRNAGLPANFAVLIGASFSNISLTPKSTIFNTSSDVRSKLSGLMSRWTMPCECTIDLAMNLASHIVVLNQDTHSIQFPGSYLWTIIGTAPRDKGPQYGQGQPSWWHPLHTIPVPCRKSLLLGHRGPLSSWQHSDGQASWVLRSPHELGRADWKALELEWYLRRIVCWGEIHHRPVWLQEVDEGD